MHFRLACPKFLRQSFHEWEGHSIRTRCGHEAITNYYAAEAKDTTRPYELLLSNGFASYFVVGKTELPMMKTNTPI